VAVQWGAIVVRTEEVVSYAGLRENEVLLAVAVRLALGLMGGEVEAVENWLDARVVELEDAVHCRRACLCGLCLGWTVWAAVEGGCRRYWVVDKIDMVVDSFGTGGAETLGMCNSLLEMSF
jgi:hypothetical protein